MSAPELWAWAPHADSEEWEGPFQTRDVAIARGVEYATCDLGDRHQDGHAHDHVDCAPLGVISRAEWIDRDALVRGMAGWIMEDALAHLNSETPWGDGDEHFTAKPGAEDSLAYSLGVWATNYITGSAWQVTGDCEPVTLPESK